MQLFFDSAPVFFFTVPAAVDLVFFIRKEEYMIDLLLNGCNAAGILAVNNIDELARKRQLFLFYDAPVLDDINGDIVINIADDVELEVIDRAFYLDDVLAAHFAASRVFDDRDAAVHFVKLQVSVKIHSLSGFNMVKDKTFVQGTNIQHTLTSRSVRIRAIRMYTPYCA